MVWAGSIDCPFHGGAKGSAASFLFPSSCFPFSPVCVFVCDTFEDTWSILSPVSWETWCNSSCSLPKTRLNVFTASCVTTVILLDLRQWGWVCKVVWVPTSSRGLFFDLWVRVALFVPRGFQQVISPALILFPVAQKPCWLGPGIGCEKESCKVKLPLFYTPVTVMIPYFTCHFPTLPTGNLFLIYTSFILPWRQSSKHPNILIEKSPKCENTKTPKEKPIESVPSMVGSLQLVVFTKEEGTAESGFDSPLCSLWSPEVWGVVVTPVKEPAFWWVGTSRGPHSKTNRQELQTAYQGSILHREKSMLGKIHSFCFEFTGCHRCARMASGIPLIRLLCSLSGLIDCAGRLTPLRRSKARFFLLILMRCSWVRKFLPSCDSAALFERWLLHNRWVLSPVFCGYSLTPLRGGEALSLSLDLNCWRFGRKFPMRE